MTNKQDILAPEYVGLDVELLIALLKLSSIISIPMQGGVAENHGLTINELRVLMCVGGEGPVSGSDICELMAIPPMGVSRAVAALETRGWLEMAENSDNRRRRPVQLNDNGWEAYRQMLPSVANIATDLFTDLSVSNRTKLLSSVLQVSGRIEAWRKSTLSSKRQA